MGVTGVVMVFNANGHMNEEHKRLSQQSIGHNFAPGKESGELTPCNTCTYTYWIVFAAKDCVQLSVIQEL